MNNKFREFEEPTINKQLEPTLVTGERIISRGFASTSEEEQTVSNVIEYAMQNLREKVLNNGESLDVKSR